MVVNSDEWQGMASGVKEWGMDEKYSDSLLVYDARID